MVDPSPSLDRARDASPINAVRLARPRSRGYKTPPHIRYVGRPTLFGNPFSSRRFGHARATGLHRAWLTGRLGALTLGRLDFCPREIDALFRLRARVLANLHYLRGKSLQCWCPARSRWCHADTLLALANAEAAK